MVSILIIEDDDSVRMSLSEILKNMGYDVECVKNGKEAIFASYEKFFNVALIDIRLPDLRGNA